MLLKATCKKCHKQGLFDIGTMTKEEVIDKFKGMTSFHCSFSNHMELMSPIDLYDFDWDNLREGKAQSEEEFLKGLKEGYKEVLTTKELQDKYIVISFMTGGCLTYLKENEDDMKFFSFVHSPKGERYYLNSGLEEEVNNDAKKDN